MPLTTQQFREAIEEEIDTIWYGDPIDSKVMVRDFAQRIVALTTDAMIGEERDPASSAWSHAADVCAHNQRIIQEKQLAEELKKCLK